MTDNILQYESEIWATADLLRGCGIKESEWPSYMMPFFALIMIESRLLRLFEDEIARAGGRKAFDAMREDDKLALLIDQKQGYNKYLFEQNKSLQEICANDKNFEIDFQAYLNGFDDETKDLLGVEPGDEGEKFLNIKNYISILKTKKVLFAYVKKWSEIDLKPYNNSEITTLEEHIKRRWADMSAETAGEQYTPDDVIALMAEIIASKIEDKETLLKIYDPACGGGNLLFGVEDRIKESFPNRYTQTFGQELNDALFALAKIESRFREDSKIEAGNTLTEDKFYNDEFDVSVANPPFGVDWKGFQNDIRNDKTGRYKHLPPVSDGQLLFTQHLISKMAHDGIAVIVHNGTTLSSGDAGSPESNTRKWMLEQDIVEAVIQLPMDEFFNTGIYTYLWVLNKRKQPNQKNKVLLINASEKFQQLVKTKGEKRKEIDETSRHEIIETLTKFQDSDCSRVFEKEYFYFNKQSLLLTNTDVHGHFLPETIRLNPIKLENGQREQVEFICSAYDKEKYSSLYEYFEKDIKPFIDSIDYATQPLVIYTATEKFYYYNEQRTLVKEGSGKKEILGCGKIVIKATYKSANKKQQERFEITVDIMPDTEKDYEIIPYLKDETENKKAISDFIKNNVFKPFQYVDCTLGVEINFNKVFYKPEYKAHLSQVLRDINSAENYVELKQTLISEILKQGLDRTVPMKDSGIVWLGQIPAHWEIKRAKDLFIKVSRGVSDGDGIITAFRDGQVTLRENRRTSGFTNAVLEHGYQGIRVGDLVIHAMDGFAGAIGVSDSNGKSSPVYSVYLPADPKRVYNPYYGLLVREMALTGFIASLGKGIRERSSEFRHKEFAPLKLPVPPLEEQKAIAEFIQGKTAQIDRILKTIDSEIERLVELRKTLVNSVVTGKTEVKVS